MSNSNERPLVTFALFSYNQENYIRQAVEAALAQDYYPLEIILSDDYSSDGTFEEMSDIVKNYIGPHRIILRKNHKNLGFSEHINVVNSIASGELLVASAGDDISDSVRTKILVEKWIKSGKQAVSIFSEMCEIDIDAKSTGKIYRSKLNWAQLKPRDFIIRNIGVFGASHAWSMEIVKKFPNMHYAVVNEDHVIPFRASLLAGVLYIDKILVSYRANIGLASNYSKGRTANREIQRSASILKRPYIVTVQKMADIKWIGSDHMSLLSLAQSRRADYLFRYWLSTDRRFTLRRLNYFTRRCRIAWICREVFYRLRQRLFSTQIF